jgi:RNA polymerase sigma-70 factor, ECF subfamily
MTFWAITYEQHSDAIRTFLHRRLRDQESAEDICQETFVKAMNAESALRDRDKVRSYLFRIANNLMINHIRRRDVVKTENQFSETTDLQTAVDESQIGPDAATEWSELSQRLRELMAGLPPDLHQAFELGVMQRRPYAEIEQITGWSGTKVKASIFRARKKVIEGMGDYRPATSAR